MSFRFNSRVIAISALAATFVITWYGSLQAQTAVTTQEINVTGEPVATPHPHDAVTTAIG